MKGKGRGGLAFDPSEFFHPGFHPWPPFLGAGAHDPDGLLHLFLESDIGAKLRANRFDFRGEPIGEAPGQADVRKARVKIYHHPLFDLHPGESPKNTDVVFHTSGDDVRALRSVDFAVREVCQEAVELLDIGGVEAHIRILEEVPDAFGPESRSERPAEKAPGQKNNNSGSHSILPES